MREKTGRGRQGIVYRVCRGNALLFLAVSSLTLLVTLLSTALYHVQKDLYSMEIYNSNALSSLDNMLKDMSRISLVCFSDPHTQEVLAESGGCTDKERLAAQRSMDRMYVHLISIRDDVKGIYIFNEEQLVFMNDQANPGIRKEGGESAFLNHMVAMQEQAGRISGCQMYTGPLPDFRIYNELYTEDPYYSNNIYLVRRISSFSPYRTIGYIALRTPIERARRILEEQREAGVSYILLDEAGYTVCGSDATLLGTMLPARDLEQLQGTGKRGKRTPFLVRYHGSLQLVSGCASQYSGMRLITMKPLRLVAGELLPVAGAVFWINLFLFAIASVSTFAVTRNNLARVSEFAAEMGDFSQESLRRHYRVETHDEVGTLQSAYNRMVDMINHLIETEYEEKARLQEAEISEQKMAMEYLKNQINPHFLYNTLGMIQICASLNGDAEVADMLQQMVKFYRLSTRVDRDFVTVEQELQMLCAYMQLMMCRYPELKFETEIDRDLQEIEVPSFILQPLVENSLLHGLKDRGYRGTVTLRVYAAYEELCDLRIEISDDGAGVPEDRLREMNRWNDCDVVYRHSEVVNRGDMHLGIRNVMTRLRLFYGRESKVLFANRPGGGLVVTLYMKLFDERRKTL